MRFLAGICRGQSESLILSTEYDFGDEYLGLSKEELLALAPTIAAGEYRVNEREVTLLVLFGDLVMATPTSVHLRDFARAFGPGLLFLLGLLTIVWMCGRSN